MRYCIAYNFVVVHFSGSDNFETDADYTEAFDLYFVVLTLKIVSFCFDHYKFCGLDSYLGHCGSNC